MTTFQQTVVELAKEVAATDPIDFGYLALDEDSAYQVVASSMIEEILQHSETERLMISMAGCVHLLIANMVLQMKLMEKNDGE